MMQGHVSSVAMPEWTHRRLELPEREIIYRLDGESDRFYYRKTSDGVLIYPSVTTIINATSPTPRYLMRWMAELGMKRAEAHRDERAHYGTLMHILYDELVKQGTFDLDDVPARVQAFMQQRKLNYDNIAWQHELRKDILAFARWMHDYNVVPLAVEFVLAHDNLGYAGAVDLICELDIEEKGFFGEYYKSGAKAGQPKETKQIRRGVVMVDFKSGKHAFSEDNAIQANMYLSLWNAMYGDVVMAEKCYNFAPKDWEVWSESVTPYQFKDQSDESAAAQIPLRVQLFELMKIKVTRDVLNIAGVVSVNPEVAGSASVQWKNLTDVLREHHHPAVEEGVSIESDNADVQPNKVHADEAKLNTETIVNVVSGEKKNKKAFTF
jgi:hypothetical protein